MTSIINSRIKTHFGERLQQHVLLSRYTTARVGGPADGLLETTNSKDLAETLLFLWGEKVPVKVIGVGSNLLVSDDGFRGVVVINKSVNVITQNGGSSLHVIADSGVNLSSFTRKHGLDGWSGMEWAAGIPGTLGGAAYGNAGANGADMKSSISEIEVIDTTNGISRMNVTELEYGYRTSILKKNKMQSIILSVSLDLSAAYAPEIQNRMDEYTALRKMTQPTGASLGSIFKNPPGDYAGRLIEGCGLKGTRINGAEISTKHANFIINQDNTSAQDIYRLIQLAQTKVNDQFGIELETEIELLGSFMDGEQ